MTSHDYHVTIEGTGDKTGTLRGPLDGLPALEVASPPQFGGPEAVWSPEHLFVASVSACLMTTFRAIAAASGIEVLEYRDHSTGRLVQSEDGLYAIDQITLRPEVLISDDSKPDRAQRILEKAEKVCLIGRSINSTVVLDAAVLQPHHVGT